MPLGIEVGLGPGDFVFDENPAPPEKKAQPHTQFLVHVYCGQTAGWMKTPLGTKVDLGPGHIVLDGTQLLPRKGHSSRTPLFSPCLLWPRSSISATAELLCYKPGMVKQTGSTDPSQWPGLILSSSATSLLMEGALVPLYRRVAPAQQLLPVVVVAVTIVYVVVVVGGCS